MTTEIELQENVKTIDLGKAVVVAERVALHNVRIIQSSCLLKPSGTKGPYEINLDKQEINIQINKEKRTLVILPSFSLTAFVIENKKEEPDFEISVTFALTYTIDNLEGLDEQHYLAFGNTNGIYNAWPYWREFIQNMTSRMGVPSLTIPVFRLPTPSKKESKKTPVPKNTKKTTSRKKSN